MVHDIWYVICNTWYVIYKYMHDMNGEENHLLFAMDMAKVGGPLSVVNVCTSMLCKNRVSVSGPLSVVKVFLHFMR